MLLSKEKLNFAGWLSIVSAFVTLIVFIMTIKDVTETKSIKALLTFISLGAFIYMFICLRILFNIRFKFHDVDKYISVLIWGNVALSAINLFSLGYSELEASLMGFLVGAFILLQIIYIIFAIRILRLPDNLFGLLRPFSYTSIAGGICLASIILIPIGFIVSAAADVILGIIFFRAAKQ